MSLTVNCSNVCNSINGELSIYLQGFVSVFAMLFGFDQEIFFFGVVLAVEVFACVKT